MENPDIGNASNTMEIENIVLMFELKKCDLKKSIRTAPPFMGKRFTAMNKELCI